MKRAVKVMAVVDVVLALVIAAVLIFDDGARARFGRLFGGDAGSSASGGGSGANDATALSSNGRKGDTVGSKHGKSANVPTIDKAALQAMLKSGRIDEAEVERRVAEIVEMKKHTIEVKRAEEERRIGEVADWFDHLMAHHPESGQKAREILNEYIDLRYATYGDMEDVDPEFARAQRESIRQRLGQRLLSELPPAQGATVMKQLFI